MRSVRHALRMRFPALTLVLIAGITLAPLLCLAADMLTVTQRGRSFGEREATVARGTVVRFGNADEFPHQIRVTGPELDFESALQATGETVEVALDVAGMFEVRCGIHPRMRLTVTAR